MIEIRQAVREDSRDIARLFLISSDGLAEYIWSRAAEPGETVMETAARRYARQGVAFSYENCLMAEIQGVLVGMAHSFEMKEDADSGGISDPVLKPYAELEDYGSLYLSGMAVLEGHHNAGIGKALMGAVSLRARDFSLGRSDRHASGVRGGHAEHRARRERGEQGRGRQAARGPIDNQGRSRGRRTRGRRGEQPD